MSNGRTHQIHVGVSGWDYAGWSGDFYPSGLPARSRLGYVAQHFGTVELNGSFYALQRPTSYRAWYRDTPSAFQFAVKGGRYITHMKRLREVEQGLANFFASGLLALRDKFGPVLWQLPANLSFHEERIANFLEQLPRTTFEAAQLASQHDDKLREPADVTTDADRPILHALEVRNLSYDNKRFYDLLRSRGVACVVADSPVWPLLDRRTAEHTYVRLHGHTELYASGYSSRSLDGWADRCARWAKEGPVFVYFDNDARGRAPYDALDLIGRLGLGGKKRR